jgi:hypothetical protein
VGEFKTKTKDKIIIVHYIGVKDIYEGDVPEFINEVANVILPQEDDSVLQYLIPLRSTSDIRVECINPVLVDKEKYEEATKKLNELETKLKQAIKDFDDKQKDKK